MPRISIARPPAQPKAGKKKVATTDTNSSKVAVRRGKKRTISLTRAILRNQKAVQAFLRGPAPKDQKRRRRPRTLLNRGTFSRFVREYVKQCAPANDSKALRIGGKALSTLLYATTEFATSLARTSAVDAYAHGRKSVGGDNVDLAIRLHAGGRSVDNDLLSARPCVQAFLQSTTISVPVRSSSSAESSSE